MATAIAPAQICVAAYQEQARKDMQGWHNWFDAFVANPATPVMGIRPKDVIWKRGKVQLYHYHPQTERVSKEFYGFVWFLR